MEPKNQAIDFGEILNRGGLRKTEQRCLIWKVAYFLKGHFTAEELLDAARKEDKAISRATVYRAMPDLVRTGILREVDVGRDFKYYTSTRESGTFKGQIVCDNCDKIIEFDAPFMEWYGKSIAQKNGLTFVSQRLQVVAHCNNCTCKNHLPEGGNDSPRESDPCGGKA